MNYSLKDLMNSGKTILGVGPVSKEVYNVCNEISMIYNIPILCIMSRRQVESEKIYPGYVSTTEKISKLNINNNFLLKCRDHGGPLQGFNEKLEIIDSIIDSEISFESDIKNNFNIIHIDTSKLKSKELQFKYLEYLLKFCSIKSELYENSIEFEIGTDDADGEFTNIEDHLQLLSVVCNFCKNNKIKIPLFVVAKTGTLVKEARQVGNFNYENTKILCSLTNSFNMFIKEHNADFLDINDYKIHNECGIRALNIAPELGSLQSKILIEELSKISKELLDEFIYYVYSNKKWNKWIINYKTQEDMSVCAIIAGHYHLRDKKVLEILNKSELDNTIYKLWEKEIRNRLINIVKSIGWEDYIN